MTVTGATDDQDLNLHIDALEKPGIVKSHIFVDKLSGARSDRSGLTKCFESLQAAGIMLDDGTLLTCFWRLSAGITQGGRAANQ